VGTHTADASNAPVGSSWESSIGSTVFRNPLEPLAVYFEP
jgi:hypothetical protein